VQYISVGALVLSALTCGCNFDPSGVDSSKLDGAIVPPDGHVIDARTIDARVVDASTIDASLIDAGPPDAPLPPDASMPLICPTGYNHGMGSNADHCYRFVNAQQRAWKQAEMDCASASSGGIAAHLVVINNEDEFTTIAAVLPGTQMWIGASDLKVEGSFLKVTGGPFTTTHFLAGEPNDGGDGPGGVKEDCVLFQTNSLVVPTGYNDATCTQQHNYLCEFDAVPPDPAAF